MSGSIFLRNPHAARAVRLPIRPGWYRLLKPSVTTCIPASLMHTPVIRELLLRRRIEVVDGEACRDADARQRQASRTDWMRAVALMEQRECDRLMVGVEAPKKGHYWSVEQIERLRQRVAAGGTATQIAAEYGLSRQAIARICRLHGLVTRHSLPSDRRAIRVPEPAEAA